MKRWNPLLDAVIDLDPGDLG